MLNISNQFTKPTLKLGLYFHCFCIILYCSFCVC